MLPDKWVVVVGPRLTPLVSGSSPLVECTLNTLSASSGARVSKVGKGKCCPCRDSVATKVDACVCVSLPAPPPPCPEGRVPGKDV